MIYALKDILLKINKIYNRKQKIAFCFLFCGIFIIACLELIGISLLAPFIKILLDVNVILTNTILHKLYVFLNFNSTKSFLVVLAIFFALFYVFKNIAIGFLLKFQYKSIYTIQKEISLTLFKKFLYKPYVYHLSSSSSDITRTINQDTGNVSELLKSVFTLITEIVVVALLVVFLCAINSLMTIILLISYLLIFILFFKQFKITLKQCAEENHNDCRLLLKLIQETFGVIKTIKISSKEKFFINSYNNTIKKYSDVQSNFYLIQQIPRLFIESFTIVLILLIIIFLLIKDENTVALVSQLAIFAVASFRLMPSINRIQSSMSSIVFFRPSLNHVYQAMSLIDLETIQDENKKIDLSNGISIKNISFQYPNTKSQILENISLTIKQGEFVGFVGQTGAGKTTLSDIILGLLEPLEGSVKVGDIDIHKNKKSWSTIVGYVPQSIYLIDDTIKNNIVFGEDEKIDEQLLQQVIEQSQLTDFIKSLPNKLETVVGENGIRLSGGQKQRIAIARALYAKPQLLVLDEATSSLDNDTEQAVMQAIDNLYGKITMIIVAHRLSTLAKCDSIYKIENNKIYKA